MINSQPSVSIPVSESVAVSKKELKKLTSIEQAKDRAQVTAATSMSIVHVALLKELLDAGPQGDKYYHFTLGLILTALILQIIAGLISLYIALLRYYFTEYKDDFLDDCLKTCMPWGCRWKDECPEEVLFVDEFGSTSTIMPAAPRKPVKDKSGCCPCHCVTNRYADYEYRILSEYERIYEQNVINEVQDVTYDIDYPWLSQQHQEIKMKLERYKKSDVTDAAANNAMVQGLSQFTYQFRDSVHLKNVHIVQYKV